MAESPLSEERMQDIAREVIMRYGIEGWDGDDLQQAVENELGTGSRIDDTDMNHVVELVQTVHLTWPTPEEVAEEEATWRSMMGIEEKED